MNNQKQPSTEKTGRGDPSKKYVDVKSFEDRPAKTIAGLGPMPPSSTAGTAPTNRAPGNIDTQRHPEEQVVGTKPFATKDTKNNNPPPRS